MIKITPDPAPVPNEKNPLLFLLRLLLKNATPAGVDSCTWLLHTNSMCRIGV